MSNCCGGGRSSATFPGRLNQRVSVQKYTEETNPLGETVLKWHDWATVWANVEGASASEFLAGIQQELTITHRVKLRYLKGLTMKMQFVWQGRILQIVSLLERNNQTWMECLCLEDVS
tara:strand:+ start:292 stop:645 length:354 start_codon:yes stop_codon:yes gene_type:complete